MVRNSLTDPFKIYSRLRYMYAQVDVIKKHFDRSNRAYQSLQVMDHSAGGHASPKLHEVGTIRTAWEEVL